MTAPLRFTARDSHLSEYPDPISFTRGTSLIIHEKYEGGGRVGKLVLLHYAWP